MASDNYPVKLVKGAAPLTLAQLPTDGLDLYEAWLGDPADDCWLGIGTPAELRGLVADGIIEPSHFTLAAEAA